MMIYILKHLHAIGKVRKMDKWVPHELSEKNKFDRLSACSAHVIRHKNNSFLDRIVTCDEKRVLYNNRKWSARWLNKDEVSKHMPKSQIHQR